jgi:hypothetical protein
VDIEDFSFETLTLSLFLTICHPLIVSTLYTDPALSCSFPGPAFYTSPCITLSCNQYSTPCDWYLSKIGSVVKRAATNVRLLEPNNVGFHVWWMGKSKEWDLV